MNHCSALPATFNCYFHQTRKPRKMNHCSALPATCTPPPLPASGPRTLLKSTRQLSAFPPAHSQPHLIWHDALHPSPGHKVAIVALVRRASRPLAETASSLAAVDRPPAFQLPSRCVSRPPCASCLRRSPCTSPRCVPIRTPPCKTRCIRRMPTSCCCRTALLPRNHNPLCTHRAAHLRLPAPDTAACDSATVPTMSVRFPTPPIAISSLPSPATLSPLSPPIHRFPASLRSCAHIARTTLFHE